MAGPALAGNCQKRLLNLRSDCAVVEHFMTVFTRVQVLQPDTSSV